MPTEPERTGSVSHRESGSDGTFDPSAGSCCLLIVGPYQQPLAGTVPSYPQYLEATALDGDITLMGTVS